METCAEESLTELGVMCASCGTAVQEPPLTWSRQVGRRGSGESHWLCETCTRKHLWAIEGKLDDLW